ncbi:hypothetical protein DQ04_07011000 [Trypanosoma grayi]|uniref:hypothetical protein n=1 Tax=Trypanosoma grayi TaxID=71804 RepID=UPI0004F45B46|nr:hypothetical protein DQ04_07011000 [Trypanosoma grayi]KEG08509.1 hypothetical protein DQ04_07011000 [Trypanosoma grayi]
MHVEEFLIEAAIKIIILISQVEISRSVKVAPQFESAFWNICRDGVSVSHCRAHHAQPELRDGCATLGTRLCGAVGQQLGKKLVVALRYVDRKGTFLWAIQVLRKKALASEVHHSVRVISILHHDALGHCTVHGKSVILHAFARHLSLEYAVGAGHIFPNVPRWRKILSLGYVGVARDGTDIGLTANNGGRKPILF